MDISKWLKKEEDLKFHFNGPNAFQRQHVLAYREAQKPVYLELHKGNITFCLTRQRT